MAATYSQLITHDFWGLIHRGLNEKFGRSLSFELSFTDELHLQMMIFKIAVKSSSGSKIGLVINDTRVADCAEHCISFTTTYLDSTGRYSGHELAALEKMVLLTSTPQILSLLATLPPSFRSELPSLLPRDTSDPIDHDTLIHLAQLSRTSLNNLLRGTKPYFAPPKPKPQPSPEYVALMARLRAQQEQREYNQIFHKQQQEEDEDVGEDNIPISLPFNILVSILCCGAAVFYMTRYWNNAGLRVLLSLAVAILVGVAEVVVYAGYLRKVKESKLKERKRKDVREIVPLSAEDEKAMLDVKVTGTSEKDEIWGRGVNGGMRRRVREKWEKEQEEKETTGDEKNR